MATRLGPRDSFFLRHTIESEAHNDWCFRKQTLPTNTRCPHFLDLKIWYSIINCDAKHVYMWRKSGVKNCILGFVQQCAF